MTTMTLAEACALVTRRVERTGGTVKVHPAVVKLAKQFKENKKT